MRSIAVASLARMYVPEKQLFAFRLRKAADGDTEVPEGTSRRYTATVLIGLAGEDQATRAAVLGLHSPEDVCGRLISDVKTSKELGETALTAWAARTLRHPRADEALETLRRKDPAGGTYPTVELSWALTALVAEGSEVSDMGLARRLAELLMDSFRPDSGLFPHSPFTKSLPSFRAHVSCFADFVYPVQALSYYHQVTGDSRAAEIACRCAETMCALQGPAGQWWWHFDIRTGRVVEGYPVYSVHQDSMAPMALAALGKACGRDYSEWIDKGLLWLLRPAEKVGALIDTDRNVIWRKVARHEPGRLVRGLQAAASRLHPAARFPGVDLAFRPTWIDYETRPYHMGWILYAWPKSQQSSGAQVSEQSTCHGQLPPGH